MKTQKFKRTLSLFLAMLMCVTTLFGMGTTAFAAEETDEVYLISYPRDGDANYGGEWGHDSLSFMNGWSTATSRFTTIRAMGSYEGNICYCIEPGVPQQTGNTFTKKGEDFWDEYPSSYNSTISPDDIKLFIGRIFQYGYTGTISTSWRSQNEGGDKLAYAVATQLLIWETVVGERDADFNKVGTGGKSAIVEQISTNHPLYSQIMSYYNSIAASVQRHSKVPSFLAKSAGKARTIELEWNGEAYTATLTDTNGVLSDYVFSANASGIRFSVSGNMLTITADDAPSDTVTITAEKRNSQRRGVITWTDGVYGPNGKLQDTGLEFPQMYEHLARLEAYIGRPITRLKAEHDFEYYFLHYTPKRKNPVLAQYSGMSWAGPRNRWCTGILKTRVVDAYLKELRKSYTVIEYVGIAADEPKRLKDKTYPLAEWGMTEKDCLNYCYERGFDWGGLYEIFHRVSCWCCPLQSLDELRKLHRRFPDLWRQLETWDDATWRTFIKGYSARDLAVRFDFEERWQKAGGNLRSRAFYAAMREEIQRRRTEVKPCLTSRREMLSRER